MHSALALFKFVFSLMKNPSIEQNPLAGQANENDAQKGAKLGK